MSQAQPSTAAVTFRGFLHAQRGRPDPVGDLARYVLGGACPGGCRFTDAPTIMRHLGAEHPDTPTAIFAAFRPAMKHYRARTRARGGTA